MELEWKSVFETENESVDLQHRYFINLIIRIENAYKNSTDLEHKRKLILELRKYADFHFTSEENIATSLLLPGISSHHERHNQLLEEFEQKAFKLENEKLSFEEFFIFLTQWFIGHTFFEDKKLFSIKSKNQFCVTK